MKLERTFLDAKFEGHRQLNSKGKKKKKQKNNWTHTKYSGSNISTTPKVKLLKLSMKKTIIVKINLKDIPLDTIPKTMRLNTLFMEARLGIK
jgi:hypothetical protein